MNNYDIARENFKIKLNQFLPKSTIESIMYCFDNTLKDYDLVTKETGLVVYDGNKVEALVEYYIKAMESKSYREKTLTIRRQTLNRFFRILGKSPTEIEHQDIYTYKYYLVSEGVAANTINSYLSQISSFFGWCVKRNIVKANPIESDDKSKCRDKEKIPLSTDEMELIRDKVKDNILFSALTEFMFSTGMRREEITKAKKSDILYNRTDANGNTPMIVPDGKGGKSRFVFISKRAMDKLNAYFETRTDNQETVFINLKDSRPLSNRTVNYYIQQIKEMTGIERLTPHAFRRTFATNAVQSGVTINAVSRIMGHASVNTTMVYAKDTMETLLTQFEKAM